MNLVFFIFLVFLEQKNETNDMFCSYFLKLFFKIVFKNIKNIKIVFSKNSFCHPNLMFFILSLFL